MIARVRSRGLRMSGFGLVRISLLVVMMNRGISGGGMCVWGWFQGQSIVGGVWCYAVVFSNLQVWRDVMELGGFYLEW